MESPPSFSTHSEAPPLSEDSGLLITSGSFSSDSASGWHHIASELQESDFEERSLTTSDSTDPPEMGDGFFNTVKKGPQGSTIVVTPIEPPPEFQDSPAPRSTSLVVPKPIFAYSNRTSFDVAMGLRPVSPLCPRKLKADFIYERRQCLNYRLLHLSPCRGNRLSPRSTLSSRLSSSHNSLVSQFQADDSSFITQAISHDTLSANISDVYNVPFDSDIYAVPVDMVRPCHSSRGKVKKPQRNNKRHAKSAPQNGNSHAASERPHRPKENKNKDIKTKRHSLPSGSTKKNATDSDTDSLHHTLREMRRYLQNLYSSSSDSECRNTINKRNSSVLTNVGVHGKPNYKEINKTTGPPVGTAVFLKESIEPPRSAENNNNNQKKPNKNSIEVNEKCKKNKESNTVEVDNKSEKVAKKAQKMSTMRMISANLRRSFCNLFRWQRCYGDSSVERAGRESPPAAFRRALPPLPQAPHTSQPRRAANEEDAVTDFATSIQKVKDYGWYWGPISVEDAEKILANEPDGSFIVRDSSDDHYIFTLTFKLNGLRHVRIEHDQGNFCFGGCTMFKAATIVQFIENAVETSRSGRYLFFLNLRPVLGPVRVQLLYPVSRFKRVQSLQHMCRFIILKVVRRDLICNLPLPRRLLDYLSATHYYSELLADM